MPELPEVQTVVNDLNKKVRGRKIVGVWFDWPKLIKDVFNQSRLCISHSAVTRFSKDIIGEKILGARRRAKNILIDLTHDKLLLTHLKMTGHFLVGKWKMVNGKMVGLEPEAVVNDPYNRFIHLVLGLSPVIASRHAAKQSSLDRHEVPRDDKQEATQLALSDVRKFAKVILGTREQIENLTELKELGPDALSPALTFTKFKQIILNQSRTRPQRLRRSAGGRAIKQVLMDPTVIAGIGNIYSDEMLWRAKIHPQRKPQSLSGAELKNLYKAMRVVLAKAVRLRGTSTSDFRDTAGKKGGYTNHRLVYQREGERCQRCKTPIKRIKVGGRSAHFCPFCQR